MYDFSMERMWWARQEERELEEREDQWIQQERAREAWELREHERWLEEQYFAMLEAEEYESYRPTD